MEIWGEFVSKSISEGAEWCKLNAGYATGRRQRPEERTESASKLPPKPVMEVLPYGQFLEVQVCELNSLTEAYEERGAEDRKGTLLKGTEQSCVWFCVSQHLKFHLTIFSSLT